MDRMWKMFSSWSIWGISFCDSAWKLPAHFFDQWPPWHWSLRYYHLKLTVNERLRSKQHQRALGSLGDMAALQSDSNLLCVQFVFAHSLLALKLRFPSLWFRFGGCLEGTSYKALCEGIWSQIQSILPFQLWTSRGIVSISRPIKCTSSTWYIQVQKLHHGKIETISGLEDLMVTQHGSVDTMRMLKSGCQETDEKENHPPHSHSIPLQRR